VLWNYSDFTFGFVDIIFLSLHLFSRSHFSPFAYLSSSLAGVHCTQEHQNSGHETQTRCYDDALFLGSSSFSKCAQTIFYEMVTIGVSESSKKIQVHHHCTISTHRGPAAGNQILG
jgi:hypothetical protein